MMADSTKHSDSVKPSATKSLTEWWITTDFFARGGKKVGGPFTRRNKALEERELLEKKSGGRTFAIDSTRRKVKIKVDNSDYAINLRAQGYAAGYEQGRIDGIASTQGEVNGLVPTDSNTSKDSSNSPINRDGEV